MTEPKKPWDQEPTPLCDEMDEVRTISEPHIHAAELLLKARDLERRLRYAWKLVNSLRIDAMLDGPDGTLDPELLEQRLSELEGVLQ